MIKKIHLLCLALVLAWGPRLRPMNPSLPMLLSPLPSMPLRFLIFHRWSIARVPLWLTCVCFGPAPMRSRVRGSNANSSPTNLPEKRALALASLFRPTESS